MYHSWSYRKSTFSDIAGNQCVEVASTGREVRVRDSKGMDPGVLTFRPEPWRAFLGTGLLVSDERSASGDM
ncbi:DUF397 domain-containing protein [Streptomyces sp. VNUA24]|nr:DUF397 domain-containing protein [Streptomyces sp. VNUA24]WEH14655.1 DUF397 domain-containing protein [Streptomyces sp. VNUA24]